MLLEETYSSEGQFCSETGAVLVVTHRKHVGIRGHPLLYKAEGSSQHDLNYFQVHQVIHT